MPGMSDDDISNPLNPAHADKTVKERVAELISIHGCPLDELFRIGMDLDEKTGDRLTALKEAAGYVYPKRKALEISGVDGAPIETKLDLTKLTDKELDLLIKLTNKAAAE
jgi:hypothetical protein